MLPELLVFHVKVEASMEKYHTKVDKYRISMGQGNKIGAIKLLESVPTTIIE